MRQPWLFGSWNSKIAAYYALKDWEKVQILLLEQPVIVNLKFETPFEEFPDGNYWQKVWLTGLLGCVYAQLGKIEESENQILLLDHLDSLYNSRHAMWERGAIAHLKARIYAILGKKDFAVDHLRMAIEQGRTLGYWNIVFDMDFVNLKGYEPFENLIKPRFNLKD